MKINIIGAGSAGCHIARAAERMGANTVVTDLTEAALRNFSDLYQQRYGKEYDGGLITQKYPQGCDLYVIATPPDTHLGIWREVIRQNPGTRVLCEKPLCLPEEVKWFDPREDALCVNYNHLYSDGYEYLKTLSRNKSWGKPKRIEVQWCESVDFIAKAHPWIPDIHDTYLFDVSRGGGSLFEHSHGLAAALGLFKDLEHDEITDFRAQVIYDETGSYDVRSDIFFRARDIEVCSKTDFTSDPAVKTLRVQHENDHFIECEFGPKMDAVDWNRPGLEARREFRRDRNDQFLMALQGMDIHSYHTARLCVQLIGEAHESR